MDISPKTVLVILGIIVFLFFIYEIVISVSLIQKSGNLTEVSDSYQKVVESSEKKILVAGDSTAVGTGTENNLESTAGRLSQKYPDYTLENYSKNGLRLEGLIEILEPIKDNKYELILIQIGANDIIRFTKKEDIEKRITEVLNITSEMSDKIIFLHSGDVGDAKIIPSFLRPIMSSRSKMMRDIYLQKDSEFENVHYVDLFTSESIKGMKDNIDKYYAKDKLHLNGEGYGLWFSEIEKEIDLLE